MAPPSKKRPANTVAKKVAAASVKSPVERVIEIGYGDNVSGDQDDRILKFRVEIPGRSVVSRASDRILVKRCLDLIGPYNAFSPGVVYKALQAHFAESPVIISVGREHSPVMFLKPVGTDEVFRARCDAFAAAAKVGQSEWVNWEYRCLWD